MELNKIQFRERPGYRELHLRPFNSNATREDVEILNEVTHGGERLEPSILSSVSGRIIKPSATTCGAVNIANGWNERRLMFAMEVILRRTRTAATLLEISGHTDYVGAIDRGTRDVALDREMRLYFNSITEIRHNYIDTPRASGWTSAVGQCVHVISPHVRPDFSVDRSTQGTMTMRPEDIFHSDPRDVLQKSFERQVQREGNYMDMRHSVGSQGLVLSDRRNDTTTHFLHRSLRALNTAHQQGVERGGIEFDNSAVLRDARGQLRERTFVGFAPMADLARDSNIMSQGFVTLGELMDMNPDFDWNGVEVAFLPPELRHDYSGSTSDWRGRDHTTIAASHIARALPTYMNYHQIGLYRSQINNMGFGGEVSFLTDSCRALNIHDEIDRSRLDAFEQRLRTELFEEMLPWEGCMFDLSISAELGRDVFISLSLDGEPMAEFAFPLFADSMVAPVVVTDHNLITSMGSTISGIVDMFGDRLARDNPLQLPRGNTQYKF